MKTNNFVVNTAVALKRAVVGVGLIVVGLLGITPLAQANSNENENVVAPYLHFTAATPTASGPYTTHFLVSNMESALTTNVNVKCYNDSFTRVGPAAGTNISVPQYDMDVASPISLGLTTDPAFTGFGWCFFASNNFDVAVSFLMGVSDGNNLITSNNAVGIVADTAQGSITAFDGNLPYWTHEGSWRTWLLALNPTAASRSLSVDIYNSGAVLLGTYNTTLSARDLDISEISTNAPGNPATFGPADVNLNGRGFAGWVLGFNVTSFESFMYAIPLDADDTSLIANTDRP